MDNFSTIRLAGIYPLLCLKFHVLNQETGKLFYMSYKISNVLQNYVRDTVIYTRISFLLFYFGCAAWHGILALD